MENYDCNDRCATRYFSGQVRFLGKRELLQTIYLQEKKNRVFFPTCS